MSSKIHLVWVASLLRASHFDRIKSLACKNPSTTIYIWVDSKHFYTDCHRVALKRGTCCSSDHYVLKNACSGCDNLNPNVENRKKNLLSSALLNKVSNSSIYQRVGGVISDLKRFNELVNSFRFLSNVEVKDLSDSHDIRLNDRNIYHSQIIKQGGGVAPIIVRDDILKEYGGVLLDIDML
ncbi:hypothetical protein [Vibrio parahaemolyticus]|uniref:hypothetical protein n=1 Tax=Vibrio parahaemolyticus TaxID=670 RepID=UPI0023618788|nr:hypothetical protein [Vibrio parahaemolyticus]